MPGILDVLTKYQDDLKGYDWEFDGREWFEFKNGSLTTVISKSFMDMGNYASTILSKYLEADKKVAIANFGIGGNFKTLENLIYTYCDNASYPNPISKELLSSSQVKIMTDYFEIKGLLLFENIEYLGEFFESLSLIPDLELLIIRNIDNPLFKLKDTSKNGIAAALKAYARALNIKILVLDR